MNHIGRIFRISIFGESHGPAIGAVLDGVPPGIALAPEDFEADLARRRAGALGTTPRVEADIPEILSGLYRGRTSGTPLCLQVRNNDTRSADYDAFVAVPRPGHADFTGRVRYRGFNDTRGSGHFSGRLTTCLVAAGVVAKKLLPGVVFTTKLIEAGGNPDVQAAVQQAVDAGDSVGALVEIRIQGVPAGIGEPFFGSLEGELSRAIFAVPGVRGVEFGDGFAASRMRGSAHNDPFVSVDGKTAKNGAGGINGGISNGNEIVIRVAMKPASTIATPQETLDFSTRTRTTLEGAGRHDACIAIRAAVALEAACAITLADLSLIAETYDSGTVLNSGTESDSGTKMEDHV
jgi:chorismate synthase